MLQRPHDNERDPKKATSALNPKVLVEITSDSTERYDRGQKLEHYEKIPSLDAVVIVSHRERRIEVWSRRGRTWEHATAGAGETASIAEVSCALQVDAVYDATESI